MKNYFYFIMLFAFYGCASNPPSFSWEKFKKKYPALYQSHYQKFQNNNLEDKYIRLSDDIIAFARQKNPDVPWLDFAAENIEENNLTLQRVKKNFQTIPSELKKILNKKIFAWSLVKNLGSSAMTISFYIDDNEADKSLILIDESFLNNVDFLSEKEATNYKNGNYSIKINTSQILPTELYFLFHEAGHAFDVKNSLTNGGATNFTNQHNVLWVPFTKLSWKWDEKSSLTTKNSALKGWSIIRRYYSKKLEDKLDNSLIPGQFNDWKNTNFVSLYSTRNVSEDWADSFAHFILKKYYNIDMIYSLFLNNKKMQSQLSCISTNLCQEKRYLLESFIKNPQVFIAE